MTECKTSEPVIQKPFEPGLPHMACVLLWYPLFTQPFIFREVQGLRKRLPVSVYSLYGANLRHCSTEMQMAARQTHTLGTKALFAILAEVMRQVCAHPLRMGRLFRRTMFRRWRCIETMGENLWAFCAGVYLARRFKEAGIDMIYAPWPRGTATAAWVAGSIAGLPFATCARGDNLEPADPDLGAKLDAAFLVRANNGADKARIENFDKGQAKGKVELVYNGLTLPPLEDVSVAEPAGQGDQAGQAQADPAEPLEQVRLAEQGASLAAQASPPQASPAQASLACCDFSDIAHSLPQFEAVPASPSPVPMVRPVRLLALGRFDVTKGFDVLLRACGLLQNRGLDFTLTLAGGGGTVMGLGNMQAELTRLRKELNLEARVSMPGLISHNELPRLLNDHDIFVAPCVVHASGRRDGIPNTVIEALAYGLPVVSTTVNALPEVVRHGKTGLAVPQHDAVALADAVETLAKDAALAAGLARNGRLLAARMFDPEANNDRLARIFINNYRCWKETCVE
ncbi:glycosyltransferase family 4 protein [Desulfovibrio sp.]|uniref:glycosyltransferase family 4 protein n=1 Tax=Desulfovibrio sp. TaxID=885 RepID=UPI003D0CC6A4